jgi:hypothetical protein
MSECTCCNLWGPSGRTVTYGDPGRGPPQLSCAWLCGRCCRSPGVEQTAAGEGHGGCSQCPSCRWSGWASVGETWGSEWACRAFQHKVPIRSMRNVSPISNWYVCQKIIRKVQSFRLNRMSFATSLSLLLSLCCDKFHLTKTNQASIYNRAIWLFRCLVVWHCNGVVEYHGLIINTIIQYKHPPTTTHGLQLLILVFVLPDKHVVCSLLTPLTWERGRQAETLSVEVGDGNTDALLSGISGGQCLAH